MKPPVYAAEELPPDRFHEIRLRTIFEHFKWDPQVEDTSALAPFAIFLEPKVWSDLARMAQELAAETIAAESEIQQRPELLKALSLPREICKLIGASGFHSVAKVHPRVMRFDFHYTSEGWRISEVNSDVPGGFIEADGFTRLVAEAYGGSQTTGSPSARLSNAIIRASGQQEPTIGLVHASAYSDDRQVAMFLARQMELGGARTVLLDPSQVIWTDGQAAARCNWFTGPIHALYRFFPAEWLPNLKEHRNWRGYFVSETPQCNPGSALLSQSKHFGALLPRLVTPMPRWTSLLPETRAVRYGESFETEWVYKPAFGRIGEGIGMCGVTSSSEIKQIRRSLFFAPKDWVAQRKFEMIPLPTPSGPQYVCFGVYTIDGTAAGIYARCSRTPVINGAARDVAILLAASETK